MKSAPKILRALVNLSTGPAWTTYYEGNVLALAYGWDYGVMTWKAER